MVMVIITIEIITDLIIMETTTVITDIMLLTGITDSTRTMVKELIIILLEETQTIILA
mgnify:CR=1 FL=1